MRSKATIFLVAVILTGQAAAQEGGPGKANTADSDIKVKVEVELRGVLSVGEEELTILVREPEFNADTLTEVPRQRKWLLDLSEAKELRKKAKALDGKTVTIKGSAVLLGVKTQTFKYKGSVPAVYRNPPLVAPDLVGTKSVLDLEHKVAVKGLTEVAK